MAILAILLKDADTPLSLRQVAGPRVVVGRSLFILLALVVRGLVVPEVARGGPHHISAARHPLSARVTHVDHAYARYSPDRSGVLIRSLRYIAWSRTGGVPRPSSSIRLELIGLVIVPVRREALLECLGAVLRGVVAEVGAIIISLV